MPSRTTTGAVVVGETTYGKGSVQSLFPLTSGDVLRLTTARWYTPLGRSIEFDRDEAHLEPDETPLLAITGQAVARPSFDERPGYTTASGRTVYGGGGIPPDVFVEPETLSNVEVRGAQRLFLSAGAFSQAIFNGAVSFLQERPELQPGFVLTEADLEDFFDELSGWDPDVSREHFDSALRYVSYHWEREIALQAWGESGQFRQSRRYDRQLGARARAARGNRDPGGASRGRLEGRRGRNLSPAARMSRRDMSASPGTLSLPVMGDRGGRVDDRGSPPCS